MKSILGFLFHFIFKFLFLSILVLGLYDSSSISAPWWALNLFTIFIYFLLVFLMRLISFTLFLLFFTVLIQFLGFLLRLIRFFIIISILIWILKLLFDHIDCLLGGFWFCCRSSFTLLLSQCLCFMMAVLFMMLMLSFFLVRMCLLNIYLIG